MVYKRSAASQQRQRRLVSAIFTPGTWESHLQFTALLTSHQKVVDTGLVCSLRTLSWSH